MHTVLGRDGYPLSVREFLPEEGVGRASVVVLGGTAVPQRAYARFAAHLAEAGLRAITFDYRGIGDSRPAGSLRGFDATMRDWALEDAGGVLRWTIETSLGRPLIVVGHSFGGQAIGLLDDIAAADGVVTVATQLGWYRHWPMSQWLRLGLMWHVVAPTLTTTLGYYPGRVGLQGVDLPAGVAREWARWCRSPNYYIDHEPTARERLAAFDRPIQMWSFTDDDFAPRSAVRAFRDALVSAPVEHHRLAPADLGVERIGHFGFFRPFMRSAWNRVVAFVDAAVDGRFAPTPSMYAATEGEIMADLAYGRS